MRNDPSHYIDALFDFMVSVEEATIGEIAAALGVRVDYARRVVHRFRVMFGHDDSINLVCDPAGHRRPWKYRLVGRVSGSGWSYNRVGDVETRLETMEAVASSMERDVDGRSIDGRKARILRRAFQRAREDIAEVNGDVA